MAGEWSQARRYRKWAMIGHKGGKCVACGDRVTAGNIDKFHFDHKVQLNNHNDKTARWGGGACDITAFTDRWFAWAQTVDLICEPCHYMRHRQLGLFDGAALAACQQRLEYHDPGEPLTVQMNLFDDRPTYHDADQKYNRAPRRQLRLVGGTSVR